MAEDAHCAVSHTSQNEEDAQMEIYGENDIFRMDEKRHATPEETPQCNSTDKNRLEFNLYDVVQPKERPSTIVLVGRTVGDCNTCAVVVDGAVGTTYVIPAKGAKKKDVETEVTQILCRRGIAVYGCRWRRRNYAFGGNIPLNGSMWMLRIRHAATYSVTNGEFPAGATYVATVAPYANAAEHFVLKHRIKGVTRIVIDVNEEVPTPHSITRWNTSSSSLRELYEHGRRPKYLVTQERKSAGKKTEESAPVVSDVASERRTTSCTMEFTCTWPKTITVVGAVPWNGCGISILYLDVGIDWGNGGGFTSQPNAGTFNRNDQHGTNPVRPRVAWYSTRVKWNTGCDMWWDCDMGYDTVMQGEVDHERLGSQSLAFLSEQKLDGANNHQRKRITTYSEKTVIRVKTEEQIIESLAHDIEASGADIIVSLNPSGELYDVLFDCATRMHTPMPLGKLVQMPRNTTGRAHIDLVAVFENSKKTGSKSYELDDMCVACGIKRPTGFSDRCRAIEELSNALAAVTLPFELSQLSGLTLGRSSDTKMSLHVSSSLLFAFDKLDFVCPATMRRRGHRIDSSHSSLKSTKPTYTGGLNIKPTIGIHHEKTYALIDFKSLYPSIIAAYDVCFTTVPPDTEPEREAETRHPIEEEKKWSGVLPRLIWKLVERRNAVRNEQRACSAAFDVGVLETRQLALKKMANSMYGCLGYRGSRFYAPHIAALVTAIGRRSLRGAISRIESTGRCVIAGDTDSALVGLSRIYSKDECPLAKKEASECASIAGGSIPHMGMAVEGVYKRVFIVAKKKFTAWALDGSHDGGPGVSKGFETTRRDWCTLGADACKRILTDIGNGVAGPALATSITRVISLASSSIRSGSVSVKDLIIANKLRDNDRECLEAIKKSRTSRRPMPPPGCKQHHVIVACDGAARGCKPPAGGLVAFAMSDGSQTGVPVSATAAFALGPLFIPAARFYEVVQVRDPLLRLATAAGVSERVETQEYDNTGNVHVTRRWSRNARTLVPGGLGVAIICAECGHPTDATINTCVVCVHNHVDGDVSRGLRCIIEKIRSGTHLDMLSCSMCGTGGITETGTAWALCPWCCGDEHPPTKLDSESTVCVSSNVIIAVLAIVRRKAHIREYAEVYVAQEQRVVEAKLTPCL